MKKYLLLISCSLMAAGAATALTTEEQLSNMKEMYINEFQKIDTNKDGQLSQDEYLTYQFEAFRANVISAEGFDNTDIAEEKTVVKEEKPIEEKSEAKEDIVLGGTPSALQAMADFKLEDFDDIKVDIDDNLLTDEELFKDEEGTKPVSTKPVVNLTKEDVMPDDLSLLTDDLVSTIAEENTSKEEPAEENVSPEDADAVEEFPEEIKKVTVKENEPVRIEEMIKSIRQTLPKKIDEITTWTDIQYADNIISYIYSADMDISEYSPGAFDELTESIQKEACVKAGQDMCPKIKPMFIDHGINMKIKYLDKNNEQISECVFNQTTCQ